MLFLIKHILRFFTSPKKILALIILLLNLVIIRKVFNIEYRWYRAHRRVWPLLTRQRLVGSKTRTYEQMLNDETEQKKHLNWYYFGTRHLIDAVHGAENHGVAITRTISDKAAIKKNARLAERVEELKKENKEKMSEHHAEHNGINFE